MGKRTFPAWPVDLTVDKFQHFLLKLCVEAQNEPIPFIYFWPKSAPFCLVITHDVEQLDGVQHIQDILEIEKRYGLRSCWNFVPKRYQVETNIIAQLKEAGCEVGVHGLYHDGKLFQSLKTFTERAKQINIYLEQWGSVGFRSPSLIRNLDWIFEYIDAEYDSSCINTEYYGAQPGGCCTVFPFIYKGKIELPITLQEDHTLLEILNLSPAQVVEQWLKQVDIIQSMHGLALINVHPDYTNTPERLEAYNAFLKQVSGRYQGGKEHRFWNALPCEAAAWWRDRQASQLRIQDKPMIEGPVQQTGSIYLADCLSDRLIFRELGVQATTLL